MALNVVTVFLIIFIQLKYSWGQTQTHTVIVKGPEYVFLGDTENFTCTVQNELRGNYSILWYFKYKGGDLDTVSSTDISEDYILPDPPQSRLSYIKINRADIDSVVCMAYSPEDKEKMRGDFPIKIRDFKVFTKFATVCEDTQVKPTLIMQRFSTHPSSHYYWASHYVTDKSVTIANPVTSFTLKCFSQTEPVRWEVKKSPEKFRYSGYYFNSLTKTGCYEAILEVGPVSVNSTQRYECTSSKNKDYQSFVDMDASEITPLRDWTNITQIEQCINLLLNESGGNGGMTGVSITSTLIAIFMLFGIVHFKRQLTAQKDKLKDMVDQQQQSNL